MDENTTTNLWNKKSDDLTVGDAVKINLYAFAIMAAVGGGIIAAGAGVEKLSAWRYNRKLAKLNTETTEQK